MQFAWRLIRMSVEEETSKGWSIFFDRLVALFTTIIFLSVWTRVTAHGPVAGFSQDEFLTYILLVHLVRPLVFLFKYRVMSHEIVNGTFATVLTLPVSIGWYYYLRSWGERVTALLFAFVEAILLAKIFGVHFLWSESWHSSVLAVVLIFGGHVLSELFAFSMNLVAFWTSQTNGPRFLYDWVAEFLGGLYFPLWMLSASWLLAIQLLPFWHFLYVPISVWVQGSEVLGWEQWLGYGVWLGLALVVATSLYRIGLRQYDAPGV